MKIEPKRLSQAMASIYGQTTPKRMAPVQFLTCPACKGRERTMTVCATCRGALRVERIG